METYLRKIRFTDGDFIVKWRNENKGAFTPQEDLTLSSHTAWFWQVYALDPSDHMFMVVADKEAVGTIAFNSRTGEIGRVLLGNKAYARKGVMSEALRQLMEAFPQECWWLRVLSTNAQAIRFYEKNVFTAFRNHYGDGGDGNWCYMRRFNA